jgi:multisubunit Na+/H+ antiporter MnhF subunit
MIHRPIFNRLIIIGFMILVGFCLGRGIYYQSVIAIVLAVVSLVAGIYFLHLLTRARQEMETINNEQG